MTSKLNWHYLGIYFGEAIVHPIRGREKSCVCRAEMRDKAQSYYKLLT